MKEFINLPENAVEEMLQGLAVLNPGPSRLSGPNVMLRSDAEQSRDRQAAIISGGGSGHEPAHAGYIGAGIVSSGVAGAVFTSPDTVPSENWAAKPGDRTMLDALAPFVRSLSDAGENVRAKYFGLQWKRRSAELKIPAK